MPKKNQLRFLAPPQMLASGVYSWNWKPSPKLRKLGWTNHKLGEGGGPDDLPTHVFAAWKEKDDQLKAWERGVVEDTKKAPPTRIDFAELVRCYKAETAWAELRPSTRAEYASRLRTLQTWALDGALDVRLIDADMVNDLRDALVRDGRRHRTAALLRVLRIVLGYARSKRFITVNPAASEDLRIPGPPARTRILPWATVQLLVDRANAMRLPSMALAIELGFWILQRQGDLLGLSRMNWRVIEDVDPRDRAVLAGRDGLVMGFRLRQHKTGAWIDAPVGPELRARVEAAMERTAARKTTWIIGHDTEDQAYASWKFQRTFRAVVDAAIAAAGGAGADAAADLLDLQFRDLRRSGMCHFGDLAVPQNLITALSGHAVLGRRSILDTYMPGNTRSACAGVAMALRKIAELAARETAEQEGRG